MALSREDIVARYGTALFDYAQDMKSLDDIHDELSELKIAVKANLSILNALSDPVLNNDKKIEILSKIESVFSKEVQRFLNLLLEYNHFAELIEIINYFNNLYDKSKSVATGIAISAVKLDDDQLMHLSDSLAKKYHLRAVRLKNKVNPNILGGVILQIKDLVIDGSVKSKLNKIHIKLVNKN